MRRFVFRAAVAGTAAVICPKIGVYFLVARTQQHGVMGWLALLRKWRSEANEWREKTGTAASKLITTGRFESPSDTRDEGERRRCKNYHSY